MTGVTIDLADLVCVCCAEDLERRLRTDPRIHTASVDYLAGTVTATGHSEPMTAATLRSIVREVGYTCASEQPALPRLAHAVDMAPIAHGTRTDRMQYEHQALHGEHAGHAGMSATPSGHAGHGTAVSDPHAAATMERDIRNRFFVALVLSVPTFLYSPVATNLFDLHLPGPANWIMLLTTTPIVFWCGWMFIGGAFYSLKHRALNMNVLVATGVLAAWGFSVGLTLFTDGETFFEAAALLVTFVLFGHWMEMKSRRGTTDALRALFDLAPPTAVVVRHGEEIELPTSDVVVGDVLRLRPGSRVPVDGVVESGESRVNEALVTGESEPVSKGPGDVLVAGSINAGGSLLMRATRVGADTTLAQIVALVERAQSSKAPGQRLADRAAQYLVLLAVGSGIVTFLAWYVLGGESAIMALTFAISAVVVACPDALGLATPTAVAVGTGLGARHNILIKDAATLERLANLQTVVFDKTGTLTEGRPGVGLIAPLGHWDEATLLRLVASAERGSEHPLAGALVQEATTRGIELVEPEEFQSFAGEGIIAIVDGQRVAAGNAKLMGRVAVDTRFFANALNQDQLGVHTPVLVAIDGAAGGVIGIADQVRPSSRAAVEQLREQSVSTVMISGDTRATAEAVASELGIVQVLAEVAPADKAGEVQRLQASGTVVAMVGDGVNDAPALATADVGIAIGAGTDVAVETAGVVLMRSDPLDVARAITLGRATVQKMKQNLFWASIYNILAIPVAAGVLYPRWGVLLRPEWAALLMSLSSIIVALNALLLKRVDRRLAE